MGFEFLGIEFFAIYDFFAGGLLGFGFNFLIWVTFFYAIYRSLYDDPLEKSVEVVLPGVLVAFILTFINIGSMFSGLITIITILIAMKYYAKMKMRPFIITSCQILINFWISANSREFGILLLGILIVYNFIRSEQIIDERKKGREKK